MLFLARLLCSDPDCAERVEEHVADLDDLDLLACVCGCTFELLAVSLEAPDAGALARLPGARPVPARERLAA